MQNPSLVSLRALTLGAFVALASDLSAQEPAFRSPGMSSYSLGGQTNRFSNEFNPAFGGVIDLYADYLDDDTRPSDRI